MGLPCRTFVDLDIWAIAMLQAYLKRASCTLVAQCFSIARRPMVFGYPCQLEVWLQAAQR